LGLVALGLHVLLPEGWPSTERYECLSTTQWERRSALKTYELLPSPHNSTTGPYFRLVRSSLLLHTLSDEDPFGSQMISGRLLNTEARFQSQGSPYEISGEKSGSGMETSLSSSA
jgi:hypothetical protein